MADTLSPGAIFRVPDDRIGESVVDEVFDEATANEYAKWHPLAARCNKFVARDPGDNLIVLVEGVFCYWDHETNRLIPMGSDPDRFVVHVQE